MKILCGRKEEFAVEYEILYETEPPARNAVGDVWFWINGKQVGNWDGEFVSLVAIAASGLEITLKYTGKRVDPALFAGAKDQVVNRVLEDIYGETDRPNDFRMESERFLICDTAGGSEWTDGWIFLLIEAEDLEGMDRVLYRGPDKVTHEVWWAKGVYERVVKEFMASLASNSATYRPHNDH